MRESKRFSGVMNLDDSDEMILPAQHKYALNGRFVGGQNGFQFQNVKGTAIANNEDLPVGDNEAVGAYYDSVRKRIYTFVYNSEGNHLLYYYNIEFGTFTSIIQIGAQTGSEDILGFNPNFPITSVNVIYTDDGDLLCWCNGNKRPRCINVDTIGDYATLVETNITLAKVWPWERAILDYTNDTAIVTNLLQKKLFQFRYRWVYGNDVKSTWSPWSRVRLPENLSDDANAVPTNNNKIEITVQTGGQDVKKIEIAGRFSLGIAWSDPFLIESISKADYSFVADSVYTYNFYNDAAYPPIDLEESNSLFSWIPDLANAQELLNGNVLIFAGITEGYDQMLRDEIDVVITTALGTPDSPFINYSFSGLHEVVVNVGSTVPTGTNYLVSFNYSSGGVGDTSPKSVNYVSLLGDTNDDVCIALAALINGNNILAVPLGGGSLRIITSTGSGTITNMSTSVGGSGAENSGAAWNWFEKHRLGLVYFDEFGKTNGVISFVNTGDSDTDFNVTMPAFAVSGGIAQRPYIAASINHTPPTWATSYQWVRTPRLLTNSFIYHVTNDFQSDTDFMYFCIQNLTYLHEKNTGFVPSYEFSEGDRIKVLASYSPGTNQYTPYASYLDFEILGTVERTMSSPASTGTFLKVRKPSSTPAYANNMLVFIYTPALQAINETSQVFYEFGQTYEIYELGTDRFHKGDLTDQTAVQAATFQFYEGDVYYKRRQLYVEVDDATTEPAYVMDQNFNDYFASAVSSNGRPNVIDPNAKQIYNPVLLRWGLAYQQGTDINQVNIFYPQNFDEIDRAKGDIMRLKARDRELRVFQKRGVGRHGVYSRFIKNNNGESQLVTTSDIITANNIMYYQGEYGIGNYPTNLASGVVQDYVSDHVRGVQFRVSSDGITPISTLYKGQFYIKNLLTPFNKTWTRSNGFQAKILSFYDFFDDQFVSILQGGSLYPQNKLSFVENGEIADGDINTPVATEIAYASNISYDEYIISFSGTITAGAVLKVTPSLAGVAAPTLPLAIQAGWTLANIATFMAALINGNPAYNATATTYLGNPAVSIKGVAGSQTVNAVAAITYPVYIATFTGVPQVGDIVRITAYYTSVDPQTYTFTFANGDTIADMIADIILQAGSYFTAESVTYNGNAGLTLRYKPSYVIVGEGEIASIPQDTLDGYAFSFNEPRNGYCSFYDGLQPDLIICAEDITFSWKEGQLYIHNSDTYCNFYGVQKNCSLQVVFNGNLLEKKTWKALTEISSGIFPCPEIYTNALSYGTQRQDSSLIEQDFATLEGNYHAAFLRDSNSIGGIINGDSLKGNLIVVKFQKNSASSLVFLSEASVSFIDSPYTNK